MLDKETQYKIIEKISSKELYPVLWKDVSYNDYILVDEKLSKLKNNHAKLYVKLAKDKLYLILYYSKKSSGNKSLKLILFEEEPRFVDILTGNEHLLVVLNDLYKKMIKEHYDIIYNNKLEKVKMRRELLKNKTKKILDDVLNN